jgi:predicted sulfurtransferase
MRQAPALEEAEDAFGFRSKVRQPRQAETRGFVRSVQKLRLQHTAKRNAAYPTGGIAEESASRQVSEVVLERLHEFV